MMVRDEEAMELQRDLDKWENFTILYFYVEF
jgi:hypothetical protein